MIIGVKEKEFVWELFGYSGSVFAINDWIAEKKIKDELSIQEVKE